MTTKRKLKELIEDKLLPCPDKAKKSLAFCFKCGWNQRYNYNCPFWDYEEDVK